MSRQNLVHRIGDILTLCAIIVSMSDGRLERVLDAAYICFTRYGLRRTTMDDIAAAAQMSRPALYLQVRNKDDAFARLAHRMFDASLADARQAAAVKAPLDERLYGILSAKLSLTLRLWRDSPHARELLDAGHLIGEMIEEYSTSIERLVAQTLDQAGIQPASEIAALAVALTRGLEIDAGLDSAPEQRLRQGLGLIVAGATTQLQKEKQ